ncbi:rhodanese-related sulfurtransferase [Mangrovivirga sp. M17]|uniref:tRNA uridine(34) hydroxylase n=1 Tax=Mangrovivirga halotolerans TaxID=2993936 RepID=A0ABT3RUB2_9BACT|nr:rhodanese-related sulfurtransferase [Mangrovivirga halotolerans]MCX2744730.1 rhodanese-related sulfurtransferase [Mangrovivirga halotolerans]
MKKVKHLYNRVNREELKSRVYSDDKTTRVTLSFYKYHHISDPEEFRDMLYAEWDEMGVLGRTYVAWEGINAQISVPKENFEQFKNELYSIDWLDNVRLNIAVEAEAPSFYKLTIKVRDKIVADGLNDDTFDVTDKGIHLSAAEFNRLAEDPNTIIVDMRNHYEAEVGHFKNALTPDVDTFREALNVVEEELKEHKDKNILMYCTGGIRCEKASAYYKHKGFKNVYQLNGGIIEYARQVKDEGLENKYIGKNFVFDDRLGERISEDVIAVCHQCGEPCDDHTNCANDGCHILFIQCSNCKEKFEGCCSDECKEVLHWDEEERQEWRKNNPVRTGDKYVKGRSEKLKYKKPLNSTLKS